MKLRIQNPYFIDEKKFKSVVTLVMLSLKVIESLSLCILIVKLLNLTEVFYMMQKLYDIQWDVTCVAYIWAMWLMLKNLSILQFKMYHLCNSSIM